MKRLFLAINNRMYCEYFKLYKIIVSYISENTYDKKIMELIKINNFPVYKDLEPFKEYNFDTVLEIHENILLMLNATIGYLENKEHELSFHIVKKNIGLNIDNFISSFNFDIVIIKEKINLFINYIEFFHKLHTKQLQRFSNKIQLMYSHVNKDIRFDEEIEIDKKKNNGIIDQSSDTDTDNSSINSNFVLKKTSNSLLSLSDNNNFTVDDETQSMKEAFLNIDSKCDFLLNSNTINVDVDIDVDIPGITINQIEESIVVEESVVVELEAKKKEEKEEKGEEKEKENNDEEKEGKFFGFKPFK
jgi:hypothetical protein